jgi:hypothetical protein
MPHAEALGKLPQLRAGERKETARQPIPVELFPPHVPVLAANPSRSTITAKSTRIKALLWLMSFPV